MTDCGETLKERRYPRDVAALSIVLVAFAAAVVPVLVPVFVD
jgi:hypothetical protein